MTELKTEFLEHPGAPPPPAHAASGSGSVPGQPPEPAPPGASGTSRSGATGSGVDVPLGGGGTPPSGTQSELVPGMRLGRYKIIRRLGEGGMSAVFEAVHVDIHKPVAIKVLSKQLAQQEDAQVRFLREAAAASRLQHPHVVDVADFGTEEGRSFLVMELMRGEDLAQHIQRVGPMAVDALADVMLPICAGVQAAHEMKIVHRDLKPQNIFLCRTAMGGIVPKVLDFGISKVVDAETAALTHSGMMMGTPYYLSPEQIIQNSADHRSDQYALGVILYECATGRRPHEAETLYGILNSITQGSYPRPRALAPGLPESFETLILRTLAQDASRRFPSVHALGKALLAYASDRQRVIWQDYFATAPDLEPFGFEPPLVSAPQGGRGTPGSTEVLRGGGAGTPAATRMLPEGLGTPSSGGYRASGLRTGALTGPLGSFGEDLELPAGTRRRGTMWVAMGGVSVVVAAGLAWVLTSGSPTSKVSATPSPVRGAGAAAGPGAGAPELPPPVATKPEVADIAVPQPAPPPVAPREVTAEGTEVSARTGRRDKSERAGRAERTKSTAASKPAAPVEDKPTPTAPPPAEAPRARSVERSGNAPILP
ncbi:MAG: serine/threonine protein kinase [Myxococcales bacterium]|nr:serine/threonine protein kinase [Myxococcales bacterium]